MRIQDYVVIVAVLGAAFALYLGMSLLSIRTRKKQFRQLGSLGCSVMLFYLTVHYGIGILMRDSLYSTFDTEAPGPPTGSASTLREVRFPVTRLDAVQEVELTMRSMPGEMAKGKLVLLCRVLDPADKEVARSEQTVDVGKESYWQTMRFSFEVERSGEYKILIEIPQGVYAMKVKVIERS